MLVSITVISSCLAISFLIVICCFWSRCPLFYSCRVNYAQRGIIAYCEYFFQIMPSSVFHFYNTLDIFTAKEEEALNQPPDENEYCHQYTPVNVKICKVNDIWSLVFIFLFFVLFFVNASVIFFYVRFLLVFFQVFCNFYFQIPNFDNL